MTISSETRRVGPYTGNSVTTAFPFTFRVFTAADVAVVKTSLLGVESTLLINADYSIALNADQSANPGGTVTYPLAGALLAAGEHLTLLGSLPAVQGTDITNTGGFYPEVVEDALDYVTILIQQLKEVVARAFVSAVSTTGTPITLPAPVANLFLKWNAAATNLENTNPYASPALTGTPTAPTAAALTNTTQLATTAFVTAADAVVSAATASSLALKAPLASPALTGVPSAPTASAGTNTTQIATTAFTRQEITALIASAPATLDTLNELAAALGADPNFATTMATALALKAPLASPTLTGVPAAPTAAGATNTTQVATTAFVQGELVAKAPLASPVFTGNPTGPTPSPGDSDTSLATTAFVQGELVAKAPLASPTLTGVPAAPTAAGATNTTQIATTAFVQGEIAAKAPLASPVFTGNPQAPTPAPGDNDTSIATTGFVIAAVISGGGVTGTANEVTVAAGVVSLPAAMTLTGKTLTGGDHQSATANTPAQGDNDTSLATTAFVQAETNKHKNVIINGNFDVWQRGVSFAVANLYNADRWFNSSGTSTFVTTRQAFTLGQTTVPGEPAYFHRTVVTSVANAAAYMMDTYKIEGVRTLAGQTATLSFWAKADANKNIAIEWQQLFGTGGAPSAATTGVNVATFALTTAWQKFTQTITIPSITGKALGTNGDDCLEFNFWYDGGSNYSARHNSLGQQSGTFDLAQVQLEAGSVATNFEYQSFADVLQRCLRYYEKSFKYGTVPAQNVGGLTGETFITQTVAAGVLQNGNGLRFSVRKRASPTFTVFNPQAANANAANESTAVDCTGTTAHAITEAACQVYFNTGAGSIPGNALGYHWTADAEL